MKTWIKIYDITQFMVFVCIKQHLTFEAQFIRTLTNTEAELKKVLIIKKACIWRETVWAVIEAACFYYQNEQTFGHNQGSLLLVAQF